MIIFVGIISIHSVVKFGAPLKCVSSVAFAFIWFGCARWNNCAIELNPSTFRLICNASSARQQWVYLWTKTQQQTIRQAYIQQYHRSVPHLLLLLFGEKEVWISWRWRYYYLSMVAACWKYFFFIRRQTLRFIWCVLQDCMDAQAHIWYTKIWRARKRISVFIMCTFILSHWQRSTNVANVASDSLSFEQCCVRDSFFYTLLIFRWCKK